MIRPALIAISLALPTSAGAQETPCALVEPIAIEMMLARQAGVPQERLVSVAETQGEGSNLQQFFITLASSVYDTPQFFSTMAQEMAAVNFGQMALYQCLRLQ